MITTHSNRLQAGEKGSDHDDLRTNTPLNMHEARTAEPAEPAGRDAARTQSSGAGISVPAPLFVQFRSRLGGPVLLGRSRSGVGRRLGGVVLDEHQADLAALVDVGDLDLEYDALEIPADPGQTIIAYSAGPGSAARDALGILASWAATHHQAGQLATTYPADEPTPQ